MKRRRFVKTVSSAGLGLLAARAPLFASGSPSEKVVVCVMGMNGRGAVLARTFAKTPNAEVAAVCDVDATVLAKAAATVGVKGIADFRRALDDKSVDALVIATPDHWHAPAAILAMSAGKHVYLEKPCGHNAREGELLVDAQRKHARVVQMGTQQRSAPRSIAARHSSGNPTWPAPDTPTPGPPSGGASPRRSPQTSTTTCGRVPRRARRTATM